MCLPCDSHINVMDLIPSLSVCTLAEKRQLNKNFHRLSSGNHKVQASNLLCYIGQENILFLKKKLLWLKLKGMDRSFSGEEVRVEYSTHAYESLG